jgi:hypothetical protein
MLHGLRKKKSNAIVAYYNTKEDQKLWMYSLSVGLYRR